MAKRKSVDRKVTLTILLDREVFDWLKSKGEGHLERINEILSNLMDAERWLVQANRFGGDMSSAMRSTVTLHVVSSLDGFIAKKDNSVSWMDSDDVYERGVSDDGAEVIESIDCYVLGARTYEHALELGWPYGDTPTVVVTHRELPRMRESVEFYSGDLERLVNEILAPRYKNIWLVGGAILGQSFQKLGLVDEIRLMVAPVTLGEGLSLFGEEGIEQKWHLKNVVAYKNGFVELSYWR